MTYSKWYLFAYADIGKQSEMSIKAVGNLVYTNYCAGQVLPSQM